MADVVLHGTGHLSVPVNLQRNVNHVSGLYLSGLSPARTTQRDPAA
jgi:hypothetical protein